MVRPHCPAGLTRWITACANVSGLVVERFRLLRAMRAPILKNCFGLRDRIFYQAWGALSERFRHLAYLASQAHAGSAAKRPLRIAVGKEPPWRGRPKRCAPACSPMPRRRRFDARAALVDQATDRIGADGGSCYA